MAEGEGELAGGVKRPLQGGVSACREAAVRHKAEQQPPQHEQVENEHAANNANSSGSGDAAPPQQPMQQPMQQQQQQQDAQPAVEQRQQHQGAGAGCALEAVGLGSGQTRLEVLWQLENEGEATAIWWPCTLSRGGAGSVPASEPASSGDGEQPGPEDQPGQQQQQAIFDVTYDAYGEFEVCTRRVAFQDGRSLLDMEERAVMRWRLEGDDCDDDDEGEGEGEGGEEEGDVLNEVVNLSELVGQCPTDDHPLLQHVLPRLPMVQQQHIALAYRGMMDVLKDKLRALMETKRSAGDSSPVVTGDDMKAMLAEIAEDQQAQRENALQQPAAAP